MQTSLEPAVTLAEHRLRVLRVPQREIARRAKRGQGAVCQLEGGKLPRPWNWDVWMAAYEIREPDLFRFLVTNAARLKTMGAPMSETEPLLAKAEDRTAEVRGQEPEVRSQGA